MIDDLVASLLKAFAIASNVQAKQTG